MIISIPYIQYQRDTLNDTWSEWVTAKLYIDDSGHFQSLIVETSLGATEPVTISPPSIFRCIHPSEHNSSGQVYWLILNASNQVYRVDYNAMIKGAAKAKLVGQAGPKKVVSLDGLVSDVGVFNQHVYNEMVAQADNFYQDSQRTLSSLLSTTEINDTLVRPPDVIITQNLMDTTDVALERTRQFQKQCDGVYLTKVKEQLLDIVTTHQDYLGLKNALKTFLASHEALQNTSLAYTALPEHPVTQLLIRIAERLGEVEHRPAISYLLPNVYTTNNLDNEEDLDKHSIADLLRTHILDASKQYLLPVDLLLAETEIPGEKPSPLKSLQGLANPYYDHSDEAAHAFVANADLARLYQHSSLTQRLRDNYKRYREAATDTSSLLGQLNTLIPILKASDAHGGAGRAFDVAEEAYPAIMMFIAYYRQLNPMGLYFTDTKPTLDILPEDRYLGYVLVRTGEDAGLYCVNRYNSHIEKLCDYETKPRYPLNLLCLASSDEIEILRPTLSQDYPTLIQVGKNTNEYVLYGRQGETEPAVWGFKTIQIHTPVRFPKQQDRCVTLALGNVPDGVYAAIQAEEAHVEPGRLLDILQTAFPSFVETCSLQDLSLIRAHTGHLDLSAFHNVPEAIRTIISNLWEFIQNLTKNLSATVSTATCIGLTREKLEVAVKDHATALEAIKWHKQAIETNYHANLQALILTRDELRTNLEQKTYRGADLISPTPAMLKYLGLPLVIRNSADLQWLYTFTPESLDAFLSDENNPEPKAYLQKECHSLSNIVMMFIQAPSQAFEPLIKAVQSQMTTYIFTASHLGALLSLLSADKCIALLHAFSERVRFIIHDCSRLRNVLEYLNDAQRSLVFDAIKGQLTNIIKNSEQLGLALEYLNDAQRSLVLDAMKKHFTSIIKHGFQLGLVLRHLNDEQCRLVFDATKEHFTSIIKDGYQLGQALKYLNDAQRSLVLDAIKGQLTNIIKNGEQLEQVLEYLNDAQRSLVFDAIKERLASIIDSGKQLGQALKHLNDAQCCLVLDTIKERLASIIDSGKQLGQALKHLNDAQCCLVLDAIKGQLTNIIKNGEQLAEALNCLNDEQFGLMLDAIKGQLTNIIKNGEQLAEALKHLNNARRILVFDVMKEHFTNIIKDGEQLGRALEYLNNAQRSLVLDAMKGHFTSIIKHGFQLGQVLKHLNNEPRGLVLDAIKEQLASIIKNGEQLRWVLAHLNDVQRGLVLDAIKDQLASIIENGHRLAQVLECLNAAQRALLLKTLENDLSNIIQNQYHLDSVFKANNYDSKLNRLVLRAIQGKLPRLSKNTKQSFFSSSRAERVQVGSLTNKLKNYIEERKHDYSLSWQLLSLSVLVSIHSRDSYYLQSPQTKCDAAAYVLDVVEGKRSSNFTLRKANTLPSIEELKQKEYTHSYCWVNERNLYFIDHEGTPHRLTTKNVVSLGKFMSDIFTSNDSIQLSYEDIERHLSPYILEMLPTTAQRKALDQGLLGDTIRDAGGINKILSDSTSINNVANPYGGLFVAR